MWGFILSRLVVASTTALLVSGCTVARKGSQPVDAAADRAFNLRDAGRTDASTDASVIRDATAADAGRMDSGSVWAPVVNGECSAGYIPLYGRPYNESRMCVEAIFETIGCLSMSIGGPDDPRCLVKESSGVVYRVPLSFIDTTPGPPYPGWTMCTVRQDRFVSSTVTPSCSDLPDGEIYDGAP